MALLFTDISVKPLILLYYIFKNGPNPASFLFIFVLFSHCMDKYSTNLTIIEKSVDGMLGSRTRGGRMEGTDESTEQWRHPTPKLFVCVPVSVKEKYRVGGWAPVRPDLAKFHTTLARCYKTLGILKRFISNLSKFWTFFGKINILSLANVQCCKWPNIEPIN